MPRSRINGNFIDKTFSIVANILLRIIPTTSGEKEALLYFLFKVYYTIFSIYYLFFYHKLFCKIIFILSLLSSQKVPKKVFK
ncbi:hypothetical protein Lalb_Chr06g0169301 [Lupinus albus]|uniref:Photosystem I assembly protein Ycf3 n=1 Tax=Lupinus albus TaxID=3870 RepID=A0A6A4QEP7_LUPAL|nr:hypothetical protein Lalb_Chr06g0169301 [Lupinus albus]